jgi:hypothetical protein
MNITDFTTAYTLLSVNNDSCETEIGLLAFATVFALFSEILPFIPSKYFSGNGILHTLYTLVMNGKSKYTKQKNASTV